MHFFVAACIATCSRCNQLQFQRDIAKISMNFDKMNRGKDQSKDSRLLKKDGVIFVVSSKPVAISNHDRIPLKSQLPQNVQ